MSHVIASSKLQSPGKKLGVLRILNAFKLSLWVKFRTLDYSGQDFEQ